MPILNDHAVRAQRPHDLVAEVEVEEVARDERQVLVEVVRVQIEIAEDPVVQRVGLRGQIARAALEVDAEQAGLFDLRVGGRGVDRTELAGRLGRGNGQNRPRLERDRFEDVGVVGQCKVFKSGILERPR